MDRARKGGTGPSRPQATKTLASVIAGFHVKSIMALSARPDAAHVRRHAVKKAIWATEDFFHGGAGVPGSTLTWNPPPSGLRVLTLWLLIITVLPLGLVLLPTPLFPLGIILIAISLLEGGLPQVRPTPLLVLLL